MGLKDSLVSAKKKAEDEKPKLTEDLVISSLVDSIVALKEETKEVKQIKPKLIFSPSKGLKKTEFSVSCEACGREDICYEVGKLLLCEPCSLIELEAYASAKKEEKVIVEDPAIKASIAALNPEKFEKTLAQDDTPFYARGKKDKYYEFFNRSYDIDKMSDEELRDSIIADGETLFEVKVKQQKKIIVLKERLAKKTQAERDKFRLDDLLYKSNEEDSPLAKPVKSAKEKALDSFTKLGLNADDMKSFMARVARLPKAEKKEEKK